MIFQISKAIILAVPALFMMLTACTQTPNYAPVKMVNQAIEPNNGYYFRKKIPIKPFNNPDKRQEIAKSLPDIQQDNLDRQNPDIESSPYPSPYQNNSSQNHSAVSIIKQKASPPLNTKSKSVSSNFDKTRLSKQQKVPIAEQKPSNLSEKQPNFSNAGKIVPQKNPKQNAQLADKNLLISKNNKEKTSIISIDNKKMLKLNFQWPIRGKISRNFAQTDSKGIEITGKVGQAVQAAEAGKAVYCGQGLAGFGNLVIIKHNASYLSAYANNSKLTIKEGQQIGKGQTIGQVGLTGFKKASLHFEIRKNGKPINPLTVMPKH